MIRPDTVETLVAAFRDTSGPVRLVGGGTAALKCAVPRLRTAALCNPSSPAQSGWRCEQ